jgi:tetratricopeptide (TPR) repeat protein
VDFAARNGHADRVVRFADAYITYLARSGQIHEREAVLRTATESAPDDRARSTVLPSPARILARLGRFDEAEALAAEAAELAKDRVAESWPAIVDLAYAVIFEQQQRHLVASTALGYAYRRLRQYDRAITYFEQSLAIDRDIESRYWEAHALDQIGDLHDLLGRPAPARAAWQAAAAIFDRLHHPEAVTVHAKLSP